MQWCLRSNLFQTYIITSNQIQEKMGRTDYEKGAKCWELKKHTMFYMLNDVMQDVCHVEILISEMSFYKISQGLNILHWQKWRFHWSTYSTQHKISFISLLYAQLWKKHDSITLPGLQHLEHVTKPLFTVLYECWSLQIKYVVDYVIFLANF